MSVNLNIDRRIKFRGEALHKGNLEGPLLEKSVHFKDHFTDDTLSADRWATSVPGTSDTIAIS